MNKKKVVKTAHEKKVELAKASAPQYGIYFDGGSVEKILEVIEAIGPLVMGIMDSDSDEKTKRDAISLIRNTAPTVKNATVSDVSINMAK